MPIADIVAKHGVSESTVKVAIRRGRVDRPVRAGAWERAERRLAEYDQVVTEVHALARAISISQASAKVGAYRVLLDALDRRLKLEQELNFLPGDLHELGDERRLADAFAEVIDLHKLPPAVVDDLRARLEGRPWTT